MTAPAPQGYFLPGTSIPRPLLFEVQNYGEALGIDRERSEQFFWHYEATDWMLPNGGLIRNWQAKLRQWSIQNRIYDRRQKERDEARAKLQAERSQPPKTGDYLIDGQWWNDYRWYLQQMQENATKAK